MHIACIVRPLPTDALATVCGAGWYTHTLPTSPSARPNAGLVGSGISPAQRTANAQFKNYLIEVRKLRHEAIPDHVWYQDNLGFWHVPNRYRNSL